MPNSEIPTLINSSTKINGDLIFATDVRIDGEVFGNVESERSIFIGAEGYVKGILNAKDIIIFGYVEGNMIASRHIALHQKSTFIGKMFSKTFEVKEGAFFSGRITTGDMPESIQEMRILISAESNSVSIISHPTPNGIEILEPILNEIIDIETGHAEPNLDNENSFLEDGLIHEKNYQSIDISDQNFDERVSELSTGNDKPTGNEFSDSSIHENVLDNFSDVNNTIRNIALPIDLPEEVEKPELSLSKDNLDSEEIKLSDLTEEISNSLNLFKDAFSGSISDEKSFKNNGVTSYLDPQTVTLGSFLGDPIKESDNELPAERRNPLISRPNIFPPHIVNNKRKHVLFAGLQDFLSTINNGKLPKFNSDEKNSIPKK